MLATVEVHVNVHVTRSMKFAYCTCMYLYVLFFILNDHCCVVVMVAIPTYVIRSLGEWHTLVGEGGDLPLRVSYERDSGMDVTNPKHGKVGQYAGSNVTMATLVAMHDMLYC